MIVLAVPGIKGRGCSSAGRAPALQAGGHRFESVHLHQSGVGVCVVRECGMGVDGAVSGDGYAGSDELVLAVGFWTV